jgi:uncharacterized OsmC-like protein
MVDLRALQRPIKERYRETPTEAVIRTTARCSQVDASDPRRCRLEAGPLRIEVEAHEGVGGTGSAPCSGDILLGAFAACQQLTTQMVAAAMGIELNSCDVEIVGDLDLQGTLGLARESRIGYPSLSCSVRVSAPAASPEQLEKLADLARRYCVVHATLKDPPRIEYKFL